MKQLFINIVTTILMFWAKTWINKHKPLVVWVTWSVGKTSCRTIIAHTLSKLLPQEIVYTSSKNFNSSIGLSLSVLGIEHYKPTIDGVISVLFESAYQALFGSHKPTIIVLEYGIDHPGDMDKLLMIVKPDISIFTSLDYVHGEYFPDGIQGILKEKIKLINNTHDSVFLSTNFLAHYTQSISTPARIIEFGEADSQWQIWFDSYQVIRSTDSIYSSFIYCAWSNRLSITSSVIWTHNISYMCIGLTIADILHQRKHYPTFWSQQILTLDVALLPWRFTLFPWINWSIIIDSTYNASPSSMKTTIGEAVILRDQFFKDRQIILVLWEMRELGADSKKIHTELAHWISEQQWLNYVIWVSGDSVAMTDYLIWLQRSGMVIRRVETNVQAIEALLWFDHQNSIIVFKSSQWTIWLEEAIKPLISSDQRSKLPRQESYWLTQKRLAKKIVETL